MECAHCNRTMDGCASIKCSLCASQFHLECISSETLVPSTNNWCCCKCKPLSTNILATSAVENIIKV